MWWSIGAAVLLAWEVAVAPAAGAPDGAAAPAVQAPALQAHATLHFRNDVGAGFRLVEARFSVDGEALPMVITQAEPGQDFVVFTGPVTSGRHVVNSHLTYQGRDRAIFTYLKGYTFNLESREELKTPGDSAVSFTIVGRERKGFNVPFEQRLAIGLEDNTATAIGRRPAATGNVSR